jgi:hypothetical protein
MENSGLATDGSRRGKVVQLKKSRGGSEAKIAISAQPTQASSSNREFTWAKQSKSG